MTAADDLIPKTSTIFIALLDEGTEVWRPVSAVHIHDGVFRILGETPKGEHWQFIAGELVRCKQKTFASGETGLVGYEKAS